MITTVCKISYGSQTVPPIVPAVQGDTGRAISFEIADFTPPAGATATYFILKPSGEAIYNSATITDNSILCELTAQSLAEAGENRMQVRVLQGENIVTSFEVILMVRTFLGDDAIESGTEMNIFDQAVEQATEQFQENAEQIVAEVIESIPEDYTELTEEVGQLNERIGDVGDLTIEQTGNSLPWEQGTINSQGAEVANTTRARTKYLIPCKYYKTLTPSANVEIGIGVFDSTGSMLGYFNGTNIVYNGVWLSVPVDLSRISDKSIRLILRDKADPTSDITPTVGNSDVSFKSILYNNLDALDAKITAVNSDLQENKSLRNTQTIRESGVELGTFLPNNGEKYATTKLFRTKRFFLYNDFIAVFAKPGYKFRAFAFNLSSMAYVGVWDGTQFSQPSSPPSPITFFNAVKGYAYKFAVIRDDAGDITTAEYDNIVFVKNPNYLDDEIVTDISSDMLANGYPNYGHKWELYPNADRLTNWMPVPAKKGDVVRINDLSLMGWVREFDADYNVLAQTSTYLSPIWIGGTYNLCGDYVVQNDCIINVQLAPLNNATIDMTPSAHNNAFSVIHRQPIRFNRADDTITRFPKSARKAEKLSTSAIVSQGSTFVNGKLWVAVDDTERYFEVINIETGEIEKTVSQDIGHCNCLDYCKDSDTLMTMYGNHDIILIPNVSEINNSVAKSNCITITVSSEDVEFFGTVCFGQDKQEIFMFSGYGAEEPFNLYKLKLGYSNGAYDGTYTLVKTYTGVILDNVETYVTPGTTGYAQDSCYDGYFYLAYGTSGHNFLVIDIDDTFNSYRVVGNYLHHEYKADGTEYGIEPEGVAIWNDQIWCLSRYNEDDISFFNHFRI